MAVESTPKGLTSLSASKNESPIFTEILKIKNSIHQSMITTQRSQNLKCRLYNYKTGNDDDFINVKYIEAEVRKESLNNGSDIVDDFGTVAVENGFPGDQPEQFIGKDLGGTGCYISNVFPLNSKLNITKWKNDQATVYNHIKNGQNCFARLFYGVEYDTAKCFRRPYEIYYHFKLYQSNTKVIWSLPIRETDAKIVGEPIEGKIINLYP